MAGSAEADAKAAPSTGLPVALASAGLPASGGPEQAAVDDLEEPPSMLLSPGNTFEMSNGELLPIMLPSAEDLDVTEASVDQLRGRAFERFQDGITSGALERAMQEALGVADGGAGSGDVPLAAQVASLMEEVARLTKENEALRKENASLRGEAGSGAVASGTAIADAVACSVNGATLDKKAADAEPKPAAAAGSAINAIRDPSRRPL